jgi:hypothetical protein
MKNKTTETKSSRAFPPVNWQVNDFCNSHGIGRTLLYQEIKRGELRIIKIGKRTLIPNDEAKAWQARKTEQSSKMGGM